MIDREHVTLEYYGYSEPGRQRARNEDACAVPPKTADIKRYGTLLVLADGVGGYSGGAEASQQAVSLLQAIYYSETGPENLADRLRAGVESVNALALLKKRQLGQNNGYLTTLVAAAILRDQIWVANVGDSRAYLVQTTGKNRRQLTEDHSGHVRLVKAGLVDGSESGRASSSITRAIGLEQDCQVDMYHYTWQNGDCLVLCSDGMASLPEAEMVSIVLDSAAQLAAKRLVERAIEMDGSDNCTAVVAKRIPEQENPEADAMPISGSVRQTVLSKTRAVRKPNRYPWRVMMIWVLLGLLVGWASAAVFTLLWLDVLGVVNLF